MAGNTKIIIPNINRYIVAIIILISIPLFVFYSVLIVFLLQILLLASLHRYYIISHAAIVVRTALGRQKTLTLNTITGVLMNFNVFNSNPYTFTLNIENKKLEILGVRTDKDAAYMYNLLKGANVAVTFKDKETEHIIMHRFSYHKDAVL